MSRETYRIEHRPGTLFPTRWIAFRRQPGVVPLVYVGHGHTREIVRETVQRDRMERRDRGGSAGG
jgi:hypothetical protein